MSIAAIEARLRDIVSKCEKLIIIDAQDSLIEHLERATGMRWKKIDEVFISDRIARVLAVCVDGDLVYSVIAYYDDFFNYTGFDVDVSSRNEVMEVLGDVV